MQVFAYTAITDAGTRSTGTLRSQDRRNAISQLLSRGLHPVSVDVVTAETDFSNVSRFGLRRVRTQEMAIFSRQLAALLKAGLPVVQALATLRVQCDNKYFASILEDIEDSLHQEGGALADAMAKHGRVFNPVFRGLIRAGEEGGNLVIVLQNLADHLSKSTKLRGQVISAFIYPSFILFLGIAAVFVLMTFVIPQFDELFMSLGQQLPRPTQILLKFSNFLGQWWLIILGVLGALVMVLVAAIRKTAVRLWVDEIALRLPVFGQLILKIEVSRISRTLGTLLRSGVGILEALRITRETVGNTAIQAVFPDVVRGVAAGDGVAETLEKSNRFPPMLINLVHTGEETGELPAMLGELAELYEEETERSVNGAVKLIEPVLIVVIGGVVAGIVAAIMLPVFEVNTMIG